MTRRMELWTVAIRPPDGPSQGIAGETAPRKSLMVQSVCACSSIAVLGFTGLQAIVSLLPPVSIASLGI